jgi:hypothetical protein
MKYFKSAQILEALISEYFGDAVDSSRENKLAKAKKSETASGSFTFAGLALHLGFSSRQEMEKYEHKGKFAQKVKRARLRVTADYEKKLHVSSSTGAIFALKNSDWSVRPEPKPADDVANIDTNMGVIQTGPPLASAEKEVIL